MSWNPNCANLNDWKIFIDSYEPQPTVLSTGSSLYRSNEPVSYYWSNISIYNPNLRVYGDFEATADVSIPEFSMDEGISEQVGIEISPGGANVGIHVILNSTGAYLQGGGEVPDLLLTLPFNGVLKVVRDGNVIVQYLDDELFNSSDINEYYVDAPYLDYLSFVWNISSDGNSHVPATVYLNDYNITGETISTDSRLQSITASFSAALYPAFDADPDYPYTQYYTCVIDEGEFAGSFTAAANCESAAVMINDVPYPNNTPYSVLMDKKTDHLEYDIEVTAQDGETTKNYSLTFERRFNDIANCYSTGQVSGNTYVGGLIGTISKANISSCYYDAQTSGQSDDDGRGKPRTTAAMKAQSTFLRWDYESIWNIGPSINDGYPYLRSMQGLTGLYARPYCLHYDLNKRGASLVRRGVDAATGAQLLNKQLIKVNGAIPIAFGMTYNSLMLAEGPLGKGWGHNYEASLQVQEDGNIKLYWTANRFNTFYSVGCNQYWSFERACQSDLLLKNEDDSYTLTRRDQSKYNFDADGILTQIQNGHGQSLNLAYDGNDHLETITEPLSGQSLTLAYNGSLLESITDGLERQVTMTYDCNNLTGITYPDSKTTSFTCDASGQITCETDGEGRQVFQNTYDLLCRVVSQEDGLHQVSTISYDEDSQPDTIITTVTDRNGKNQIYQHNSQYELEQIIDQLGNKTSFTYDDYGNRNSITDAVNSSTTMYYDSQENLLTVEDQLYNATNMTYDTNNNLLTITNANEKTTTNIYDANNNLTSTEDSLNQTTSYSYDSNGLLTSVSAPRTGQTVYTYQNGQINTVTDPEEVVLTYGYDDAGRLTSITNADDQTSIISYDARDNVIQTTDPLNNTASFTYDSSGKLLTRTDARNNTTAYAYDDNLNLISLTDALGHITSYFYDPEGRLIKTTDARGNVRKIAYDDKGRPIANTNPLGYSTRTEYDAVSNMTARYDAFNKKIAEISYDEVHNPRTITDALGNTTTNEYNNLNRLSKTTNPLGDITEYSYDDLNRLNHTIDPSTLEASQEFDEDGNRKKLIDPDANALNHTYDLASRLTEVSSSTGLKQYTYNHLGYLATATNGRSQTSSYVYDDAGRLTSRTDPDGTITYGYDANGNLLTVTDTAGTITRVYDELNRVTSYTDARGNNLQYQYDEAGNLTVITYPDEKQVNYSYDAVNRLTGVTDWASRTTEYSYDANGRLIKTVRANGSTEIRSYIDNGSITKIHDVDHDNEYNYEYDEASNITAERSISSQSAVITSKADMTVTTDNRLDTYNGDAVTYDADGNMTYGPLNGIMESYTYDSRNRLTAVGTTSYSYDAENKRIGVTVGSNATSYVINPHAGLSQVLTKTDPDDTVTYYVYGLGLIGEENEGDYKSYHYDLRGSTVALTDMNGAITDSFQYGIYGEMQRKTGSVPALFLFNGKYGIISDNNGLYYMRARYYSPEIMRFIRQDDLVGNVTNPLSLNRHAFVKGNPVMGIDPSGHATYQIGGLNLAPTFEFDSGFQYNPNVVASKADYRSWNEWGIKAWVAGFDPWLKDAAKMYKHYRDNTGTDMYIDFGRAFQEDNTIKAGIDNEIYLMQRFVESTYQNGGGTSFEIIGGLQGIGNGTSDNWQKTIGAFYTYGYGVVAIDSNTGTATMVVTFYMEDIYNFNPGMYDIASGTPDAVNGRFAELGWAKEFKTYGSLTQTITWNINGSNNINAQTGGGR